MSETQTQDPQVAYNVLQNKVASRVFFQKLAAYGIEPKTAKEAQSLLELGGKLRIADDQVKQASDDNNTYLQASQALDATCQQYGIYTGATPEHTKQASEASYAQYASQLADDPHIYNAVLQLKQAQADAVMSNYS